MDQIDASAAIRLLGTFQMGFDGHAASAFGMPKAQSLAAFLILRRDAPQSRQQLSFLLWPDSTEAQARNNLRQLVFSMRQAWPSMDRFIHVEGNTLQWLPPAHCQIDVEDFDRAIDQARRFAKNADRSGELGALQRAVDVYRGELLPSGYDDWIAPERDRLRDECVWALARLVQLLEQDRAYPEALEQAQRLLRLDPLREAACVTLMRLHSLVGDRASAARAALLDEQRPALPPRVYGVIVGRLHQLTPATRELTGLAATIGRSFNLDLLAAASERDRGMVAHGLDALWHRRIVRPHLAAGNSPAEGMFAYDFSHDKLREVAYAELAPMQWLHWHSQVAHALERLSADHLDPVSARIAAHFEQAGLAARAIPY